MVLVILRVAAQVVTVSPSLSGVIRVSGIFNSFDISFGNLSRAVYIHEEPYWLPYDTMAYVAIMPYYENMAITL